MKQLNITYSVFKTMAMTYTLSIYYLNRENGYTAYLISKELYYAADVCTPEDIVDFDTNFKPLATNVQTEDDAAALASYPIRESGSSCSVATKGLYVDGKQIEIISGNSTGACQWQYASDIELQGVDVVLNGDGAKFGDVANLTIEHPVYGEINRFGNNVGFIGKNIYTVLPNIVAPLPAGLIIKCNYIAADTNGRQIAINLRCYK